MFQSSDIYSLIKSGRIQVKKTTSPPEYRFWNKVSKDGPIHPVYGQCWVWLSPLNHNGYGQFMIAGEVLRPHRYSYELHIGDIPEGLGVLHHCDNPSCVRPSHLFVGTALDNQRDKVSKDRQARGEGNARHKLTEEEVIEIRRRYKLRSNRYHDPVNGQGALAKEFHTTQANISIIVREVGWRHLKADNKPRKRSKLANG